VIAEAIAMVLKDGESRAEEARALVKTLTDKYPLNQ
jgi:glycine hydroxymethyltransferase